MRYQLKSLDLLTTCLLATACSRADGGTVALARPTTTSPSSSHIVLIEAGTGIDTHELRLFSHSRRLVVGLPVLTNADVAGLPLDGGPSKELFKCAIQEVDGDGNFTWQWNATTTQAQASVAQVPQVRGVPEDLGTNLDGLGSGHR
jgi:hypothetical protein